MLEVAFYSSDSFYEEVEGLSDDIGQVFSSKDALIDVVRNNISESAHTIIFLDFDYNRGEAEEIIGEVSDADWCTYIVMTSTMTVQEIRDHQRSDKQAGGYLKKPLDKATIQQVIEDVRSIQELVNDTKTNFKNNLDSAGSDVQTLVQEHELLNNDFDFQSDPISNKIQEKFNIYFEPPNTQIDGEPMSDKKNEIDDFELDQTPTDPADNIDISLDLDDVSETESNIELSGGDDLDLGDLGGDSGEIELGDLGGESQSTEDLTNENIDLGESFSLDDEGGAEIDLSFDEDDKEMGSSEISFDSGDDEEEFAEDNTTSIDDDITKPTEINTDMLVAPDETQETMQDLDLGIEPATEEKLNIQANPLDDVSNILQTEEEDEGVTTVSNNMNIHDMGSFDDTDVEEVDLSGGQVDLSGGSNEIKPQVDGQALQEIESYNEQNILRLQGIIKELRAERESLLEEVSKQKSTNEALKQDNLGLTAELDELKIELNITNKRKNKEVEDLKTQLNVSEQRREIAEEHVRSLKRDFDNLSQQIRVDVSEVKNRERELENKLELAAMDTEAQMKSRDNKILELKRKIDALEFNLENAHIREQKSKEDKTRLEDRLEKIMGTLRGSIQILEEDIDLELSSNEKIRDKSEE